MRGGAAHRHTVEHHLYIVAVGTNGCVAHSLVAATHLIKECFQPFRSRGWRVIRQGNGLTPLSGNGSVETPRNLLKSGGPGESLRSDYLSREIHLKLHCVIEIMVHTPVAEQLVALFESRIIAYESLKIGPRPLRNDHIHPTSALLACSSHEVSVLRRGHNQRKRTDMLTEASVFLASALQSLTPPGGEPERKLLGHTIAGVVAARHGKLLSAVYHHGICDSGETLTEAQEMDGIEQIAFTHTVVTKKSIDFR